MESAAIASPKFGDHLARKCATTQQSRNRYVAYKFLDTQHSPRSVAHASSEYIGCSRQQAQCTLPNSCRILRKGSDDTNATDRRQTGGGDTCCERAKGWVSCLVRCRPNFGRHCTDCVTSVVTHYSYRRRTTAARPAFSASASVSLRPLPQQQMGRERC